MGESDYQDSSDPPGTFPSLGSTAPAAVLSRPARPLLPRLVDLEPRGGIGIKQVGSETYMYLKLNKDTTLTVKFRKNLVIGFLGLDFYIIFRVFGSQEFRFY